MAWGLLVIAGLFETVWAVTMKYSHGFTKPVPSILTFAAMGISFFLLSWTLRTLPIGTAYAVWTGIGATGSLIAGIILFDEPVSMFKIISALLLLAGMAGLKLSA